MPFLVPLSIDENIYTEIIVKIKGVIACDVSPVAMFGGYIILDVSGSKGGPGSVSGA